MATRYERSKATILKYYYKNREAIAAKTRARVDGYRFSGNREVAIARDGYKCTECGMTNDEHIETFDRGLSIHHIDENGRNKKVANNDLENLTTLCLKCHARVHKLGKK